jgi:hypothetical protein
MVLKTSIYSLSEKDEYRLIENKEAVSMIKSDSPDIIDNIGLNENLLTGNNLNIKQIPGRNKKESEGQEIKKLK